MKYQVELGRLRSAGRANIRARPTILALGGIDHVQTADLGDSAFRALGFASTALNAIIRNYVSHGIIPFLYT